MDLKFYLSLFLRRLPYFLIVVAFCSAIGLTLASVLPPVYLAQARLVVESEQIPDQMAASTVQVEATEQLQIIQQRILTRDRLIEMANRLQIYAATPNTPARRLPGDEIVEDLRNRIKIVTTGGRQARGPVQATIVSVSFEAPTAVLAATVTNEVVTLLLQENVTMRTGVAGQTLEFFTREVARLDQELAQRGGRILEFKQANGDALPDSLDFRRSQQAAEQERLLQLEREEAQLRDRRARLVALFEATGRVDVAPGAMTPEQRQLQGLRDQLSGLLAVLTPQNPRVKMLEAQIAALERTVTAQSGATGGPQLSAYDIQLSDIDGQLDYIASQKVQIGRNMETLRKSIEATPGNAITLDTLERDYANIRIQYDQAVANRARAETGDTIEALAKGQRISVIEQAIAPREPQSPNRPLIAGAGVGGGIALGLGLVVLLEVMKGAIRRPVDLTRALGITPFGTVPYLRTRGQIWRRRIIIGLALLVVLVGIPLSIWAVHTFYQPLDLMFDQILRKLGLA